MENTFFSQIDKEKIVVPGLEQVGVVALVSQFCFSLEGDNSPRIMKALENFYCGYVESNYDEEQVGLCLREAILDDILNEETEQHVMMSEQPGVDFFIDDSTPVNTSNMKSLLNKILTNKHFALSIMEFLIGFLKKEDIRYMEKYDLDEKEMNAS
jgi:hypothetical protein